MRIGWKVKAAKMTSQMINNSQIDKLPLSIYHYHNLLLKKYVREYKGYICTHWSLCRTSTAVFSIYLYYHVFLLRRVLLTMLSCSNARTINYLSFPTSQATFRFLWILPRTRLEWIMLGVISSFIYILKPNPSRISSKTAISPSQLK